MSLHLFRDSTRRRASRHDDAVYNRADGDELRVFVAPCEPPNMAGRLYQVHSTRKAQLVHFFSAITDRPNLALAAFNAAAASRAISNASSKFSASVTRPGTKGDVTM